jgi:hypothetical protein
MRTQMITQALTIAALGGPLVCGTPDAQLISGERALLNRVGAGPVTSARPSYGPIDPAGALLGRSTERNGFQPMRSEHSNPSPARVGAEMALQGRGAR